MNNDLVSLIVENKNEIVKLQRVVDGKAPMTRNLDMGGYRIFNVAHPRDPREYESDLVTSKILYDYVTKVDQNYMRRDRDGSLDGRLDMSNHRISGLADPTDADDAVSRRYVASRFQALSDEVQDKKSKLDALQNFLGVVNNQVLIRKYELIDTDFEKFTTMHHGGGEGIRTTFSFVKHPLIADDLEGTIEDLEGTIDEFEFIDSFTLKEYFIPLLEEPVDDVTWLRIKQTGTF